MPRDGRLSAERIVATALELMDRDGLAGMSARTLAQKLGVQPMAIYHHLPGMEAVLDGVLDAVLDRVMIPQRTGVFEQDLKALTYAYVAALMDHPQAIPLLAGRRFNSRASMPFLEEVFRVFADAGLAPPDIASGFRMIGYFVHGALMAWSATQTAARRPDFRLESPEVLAGHPIASAVLPHLRLDGLSEIMDAGLDLIIDGLRRRYLTEPNEHRD